ncbi:Putative uncharacterized protein [Taphrina deformans PYCC 5710]|uniref:Uncharacterized protein n=1 Tax=Taphrina deformans (strain PYCC 5710 / ATCC 11124 / CBS 356.35 / IMI 108563 / JCM 9778 / NBRC 8474) TaxID=1097556 RepID=R4X9F5_TAPDE|nr:Putative uncharacterized protein [Taphrina deformans PYCC 5710]|eukprot:CCG82335.1 Putative uncharacterized protein [Taphrina deformans PYCC 5710]
MSSDDALSRAEARVDPETGTFRLISWSEVVDFVSSGSLDRLTRSPTQLREYQEWKRGTLARFGSIERFILEERLEWSRPITAVGREPCSDRRDWKCLRNDFPYAMESEVSHLVVWSKVPFETSHTGELTDHGKAVLEHFLYATLFHDVERDRIVYFLNPPGLKSIAGLEHFHVLLRGVDTSKYVTSQK